MKRRKRLEVRRTIVAQAQAHYAVVLLASLPHHQPCLLCPVDQANGAVMTQQEVVGHLANGGPIGAGVPPDGQEQLVLRRGQPRGTGLVGAPGFEVAEPCT